MVSCILSEKLKIQAKRHFPNISLENAFYVLDYYVIKKDNRLQTSDRLYLNLTINLTIMYYKHRIYQIIKYHLKEFKNEN